MNIQRFTAPTSREAMNKARKTFGDSAVILSTRNTGDGFEVMAAAEESLASLAEHAAAPVVAAAERAPQRLEAAPARASKPAVSLAAAQSVQSDTETLAMSTLSFQDYVRERMLRKRREALHGTPAAFEHAHVDLCQRLAEDCMQVGVKRVVHVSALGVGDDPTAAPSHYLRTKAEGEQALRVQGLDLTVLRPSVIFGAHDRFFNLFAALQKVFPVVPLAGSEARFQPVWVEDVAAAIVRSLADPAATVGRTFELGGPEVCTLAEIVKLAGRWSGNARPVVPLPMAAGRLQAAAMAWLPGEPLMSRDNLDSMKIDNIASRQPHVPAPELGITPTAMEAEAPRYLSGQTVRTRLDSFRARARR